MKPIKLAILSGTGVLALSLFFGSVYTIEQGERGVIKRFGAVTAVAEPGLNFKMPFVDSVTEIEIRTRKALVSKEPTSTSDQLPSVATISVNWTVDTGSVADLYSQYGSLDTLEQRVLYPKMRSALKVAVAQYSAEEVNRNRNLIVQSMTDNLRSELNGFPLSIDSVQLENIVFPRKYVEAIEAKQTELQKSKEEEHRLARQKLTAQQSVNTAQAEADAKRVQADADAYAVEVAAKAEAGRIIAVGEAEASSIEAQAKALKANPDLIDLRKAEQWDGKLPTTNLGGAGGANFLFELPSK